MKSVAAFLSFLLLGCASTTTCTVSIPSGDGKRFELQEIGDELFVKAPGAAPVRFASCVVEAPETLMSPDGMRSARRFVKNCGATVDFATHVAVEVNGKPHPLTIFSGRPSIRLRWSSANSLQIETPVLPDSRVYRKETSHGQTSVVYKVNASLENGETPRPRLDQANRLFGMMGFQAGLPKELLHRSAGWAQSASGLHRPEWGKWNDQAECH